MSKVSGLVLIACGLAVAAYAIPRSDEAAEADQGHQADLTKVVVAKQSAKQAIVVPEPRPAPRAGAFARATESPSSPVVVTIARPTEPAVSPAPRLVIPKDRDALARELQKELRRVGCYDGELNGAWTPATRRAMKAFTDRVNASLPVEEPDAILFAMVQGQPDRVCGKPCPVGQAINEEGRCLPNAILAKAGKKAPPADVAALTKPVPTIPERKPAGAISGWSTTTTAAAPIPTPPVQAVQAPSQPPHASPPPDGRMALAGPAAEPTSVATTPVTEVVPPVPAARPASPPRQAQSGGGGWARSINRRYDSPN